MTLDQFLQYASGAGVSAVVAVILSFIVEYIPSYDVLAPKYKRLVFIGMSFVVPLLASLAGVLLVNWPMTQELIWSALVAGASAAGIGTLAHTRKL